MDKIEGSELNRRACEALGWYDIHEYADHHHDSGRHPELVSLKNNQPVRMPLPAIATDSGVALTTMNEWVKKKHGYWTLRYDRYSEYPNPTKSEYLCEIWIEDNSLSTRAIGDTMSECIARAIVAASEAKEKR